MLIYICVVCTLSLSNSFVLANNHLVDVFICIEASYDNKTTDVYTGNLHNNSILYVRSESSQYRIVLQCTCPSNIEANNNIVWNYPNGSVVNSSDILLFNDAYIDEGMYRCVIDNWTFILVGLYIHDINSGPNPLNIKFDLMRSTATFSVENATAVYVNCIINGTTTKPDIAQHIESYQIPTRIFVSVNLNSNSKKLCVCSVYTTNERVNIYENELKCPPVHLTNHVAYTYVFFVNATEPLLSSPEISSCIQTQTPSTTTISFSTSTSNVANTNSIMCNFYLVGIGLLLVTNLITVALCIVFILLILKKHFKNEKLKVNNQPSDTHIEQTQSEQLNHTYSVLEVGPTQNDYTYSEITIQGYQTHTAVDSTSTDPVSTTAIYSTVGMIEPDTSTVNNPAGYIYSTVDKKRNNDSTKCVYSSADNIAVVSDQ